MGVIGEGLPDEVILEQKGEGWSWEDLERRLQGEGPEVGISEVSVVEVEESGGAEVPEERGQGTRVGRGSVNFTHCPGQGNQGRMRRDMSKVTLGHTWLPGKSCPSPSFPASTSPHHPEITGSPTPSAACVLRLKAPTFPLRAFQIPFVT